MSSTLKAIYWIQWQIFYDHKVTPWHINIIHRVTNPMVLDMLREESDALVFTKTGPSLNTKNTIQLHLSFFYVEMQNKLKE